MKNTTKNSGLAPAISKEITDVRSGFEPVIAGLKGRAYFTQHIEGDHGDDYIVSFLCVGMRIHLTHKEKRVGGGIRDTWYNIRSCDGSCYSQTLMPPKVAALVAKAHVSGLAFVKDAVHEEFTRDILRVYVEDNVPQERIPQEIPSGFSLIVLERQNDDGWPRDWRFVVVPIGSVIVEGSLTIAVTEAVQRYAWTHDLGLPYHFIVGEGSMEFTNKGEWIATQRIEYNY